MLLVYSLEWWWSTGKTLECRQRGFESHPYQKLIYPDLLGAFYILLQHCWSLFTGGHQAKGDLRYDLHRHLALDLLCQDDHLAPDSATKLSEWWDKLLWTVSLKHQTNSNAWYVQTTAKNILIWYILCTVFAKRPWGVFFTVLCYISYSIHHHHHSVNGHCSWAPMFMTSISLTPHWPSTSIFDIHSQLKTYLTPNLKLTFSINLTPCNTCSASHTTNHLAHTDASDSMFWKVWLIRTAIAIYGTAENINVECNVTNSFMWGCCY